jgi:hypothetical protein
MLEPAAEEDGDGHDERLRGEAVGDDVRPVEPADGADLAHHGEEDVRPQVPEGDVRDQSADGRGAVGGVAPERPPRQLPPHPHPAPTSRADARHRAGGAGR